jgi:molybdopterin converting factor small subunit
MHIKIKPMAALRSKLPPGSIGGVAHFELEQGATVASALEKLGLATGQVHLVLVNGNMEHDRSRLLSDEDELTVFPPVAGG